jgi:hypothetical protein
MNGLFTDTRLIGGESENLEMGYYLYTEGVMALKRDSTGTPIPTNYREPVPPIVNALFMYVHPSINQDASIESFKEGVNTKRIKKVNLIWILLLQLGVGYLVYIITKHKYLPFLSLLLVLIYFIRFGNHFDGLFTELPAATIIIWCSIFLVKSFEHPSWGNYLTTGVLLGLLILTKAMFFYLSVVIIVPILILTRKNKRFAYGAILVTGTLIIVAPW